VLAFLPISSAKQSLGDAWKSVEADLVLAGVAFATEAGVAEFRKKVIGPDRFDGAEKRWLVGIQGGVSQPKALQRLAEAENSEARVPYGQAALADPALNAPVSFHPKAFYFENGSSEEVAVVSTSANLTFRALTSNVEQVLVWRGTRSDDVAVAFRAWWEGMWNAADAADGEFLAEYEAKRPRVPPPPNTTGTEPADSALRAANSFWIELTRKPESDSHNQIELLFNGHLFFYPNTKNPSKAAGRRLSFEDIRGNVYEAGGRQITFNGPPRLEKGNGMWRVYMPTLAEGFSGYQDGDVLVRFTRTATGDRYRIEVAPVDSPRALLWAEESTVVEKPGSPPRRMGWT
jgi:HKD family nuclease